ncbi:YkgJ family cysteine cluster protein [Pseudooceanicola sediminis]|uniref:YkgJ family cysteine cluster protein n=1 Tax=Pseudooceanicola sediminis TaxID=2211117 RepID=UPI0013146218|nr:YkgJ family cysteine cluster protein [Pseudooceanicola sediminis]
MSKESYDCVACGACCFGGHDKYIQLFAEDLDRGLPDRAVVTLEGKTYMKMEGGHCAQLIPLPGGGLACAVYSMRPTACRAFRAGSFECGRSRHHRMAQADAVRLPLADIVAVPPQFTPADIPDAANMPDRPQDRPQEGAVNSVPPSEGPFAA